MDKRKYLHPDMIAKLGNMSLKARLVVEGYIIGMHKSPYHGFSVEFAEHRAYGPGDEIRHIDWKLYGKTDRYYVKQFEEETNLRTYILLDSSLSMTYTSHSVSKLEYGTYLAAALSYLMINQQDGVGLILFDNKVREFLPARSTPSHINILLSKLDKINPGADTEIGPVLNETAERFKKRGLVIVISDFLDDPESVMNGLKHFRYNKQEVIVFQLIDPQEIEFDFNTRTRFQDLETGEFMLTEPWQIRDAYQKLFQEFQNRYRRQCRENRIDFVPLITNQSLDIALTEYLRKRQKIG